MKLIHTNESDFNEVERDYPDYQYELAKSISNILAGNIDTPIITSENPNSLILFSLDKSIDRLDREINQNGVYKITIEHLKTNK